MTAPKAGTLALEMLDRWLDGDMLPNDAMHDEGEQASGDLRSLIAERDFNAAAYQQELDLHRETKVTLARLREQADAMAEALKSIADEHDMHGSPTWERAFARAALAAFRAEVKP